MKKVILLTGASSGIGYQTAESLAKEGHVVYGAARRTEKMEKQTKNVMNCQLNVVICYSTNFIFLIKLFHKLEMKGVLMF